MGPLTHNLTGLSLGVGIAAFVPESQGLPILAGVFMGARAPDWMEIAGFSKRSDSRWSVIPHRTITHWPWIWVAMFAALIPAVMSDGPNVLISLGAMGFAIGCLLHILMDYLTPMGVPIGVNPFGKKKSAKIMRTGSMGEIIINIAAIGLAGAALVMGPLLA